jgi:hypothetical protein
MRAVSEGARFGAAPGMTWHDLSPSPLVLGPSGVYMIDYDNAHRMAAQHGDRARVGDGAALLQLLDVQSVASIGRVSVLIMWTRVSRDTLRCQPNKRMPKVTSASVDGSGMGVAMKP